MDCYDWTPLSKRALRLIRDVLELRRGGGRGIMSSKKDTLLLEDLGSTVEFSGFG